MRKGLRVHVLRNEGGGLAPWNIGQYYLKQENGKIEIVNKKTERKFPLIFYHFQGFELLGRDYVTFRFISGQEERLMRSW